MDGDATDVCTDELYLADVDAGTDMEAITKRDRTNRRRTVQRAGSSVEQRKHSVPSRLDLSTAEALELCASGFEVSREELAPVAVTKRSCGLRRADEIGE